MKELGRRIFNVLPNRVSLLLFALILTLKNMKMIINTKKMLNSILNETQVKVSKAFVSNLKKYCTYYCHVGADLFIDSYFKGEPIKVLSLNGLDECELSENDPIMICCVKNDLERIKQVIYHHRKIGIKKMVFVDNMSDDGTREYLFSECVDLYSVDEPYHAGRKAAWIRKIQDLYGYNRWYLIVDSDELFSYVGMEKHSICELVKYLKYMNVGRARSFLLDMYPNHKLYSMSEDDDIETYDFTKDYRFFDKNTYYNAKDGRGYMVRGGPRKRCFEKDIDNSEPLTKYPLIFSTEEDIWADHRPMPFEKNFESIFVSVLRHYKFMHGDNEKYINIAKSNQYYNNSANYKVYISHGTDIEFYYEDSEEYFSSVSLRKITLLEEIDWNLI